jgi:hypothetical protein
MNNGLGINEKKSNIVSFYGVKIEMLNCMIIINDIDTIELKSGSKYLGYSSHKDREGETLFIHYRNQPSVQIDFEESILFEGKKRRNGLSCIVTRDDFSCQFAVASTYWKFKKE